MIFPLQSCSAPDTHLHELVIRLVFDFLDIVQRSAIIQTIQIHDLVLGVLVNQQGHNMRRSGSQSKDGPLHKASSSRDEDVFWNVSALRFHGILRKIDYFVCQFDSSSHFDG